MTSAHERLAEARAAAGYETAADAARALGVREPTYFGHENGSRGLGRAAQRYATFFKVSLDWLLTGRGEMRSGVRPPRDLVKSADFAAVSRPVFQDVMQGLFETMRVHPILAARLPPIILAEVERRQADPDHADPNAFASALAAEFLSLKRQ